MRELSRNEVHAVSGGLATPDIDFSTLNLDIDLSQIYGVSGIQINNGISFDLGAIGNISTSGSLAMAPSIGGDGGLRRDS